MEKMSFAHIVGYKKEKESLKEICTLLQDYQKLSDMGIRLPHGVLLFGEPGVGKTVMAEALIAESGVPCVRILPSDNDDDDLELADCLEKKFALAVKEAPSIIFIDELDKMVGDTSGFQPTYNMPATRRFLQVMNDHKDDAVIVIATVNDPQMVCPALRRSGRFDRIINVGMPKLCDRQELIAYYSKDKSMGKDIDYPLIAKMTAGLSGADIECILNEAGIHSALSGEKAIGQKDILYAIDQKLFNGVSRENAMNEKTKAIVAVHEAGHLIVGLALHPDEITGVSILPQGDSEGHVAMAPFGEEIQSLNDIKDRMTLLLAGRACEKEYFPTETYLGSSNDISHAMCLAVKVVKYDAVFGFDACYIDDANKSIFSQERISEKKIRLTETLITDLMNECSQRATLMISEHIPLAEEIIYRLKEKYVLSRSEIMEIWEVEKARKEEEQKRKEKARLDELNQLIHCA